MVFSLLQRWRQERRAGIPGPIETSPQLPEDDMSWFFPPRDVHDSVVWDRYWHDQVTHGLTPPLFDMFCRDDSLIQCLIKRGARTVLCAGNGMSQEPRALAAARFEVTAMDLSPAAMHLAETWQFTPKQLDGFCTAEQRAPGGSARFVIGDILDRSICPGPFDAIIERRTLQLFPEEERGTALDALASRLQPNGLFLSHCHDGGWKPPGEPVHQVEQLLRDRSWFISRRGDPADHAGRMAWLEMSTG
jgi:Methyltransferase domain